MSTHSDESRRLEINWVQTAGGALAAVSSAVLLSTTGVAGTIIGAALGSVVVTVGNSVYSHYLAASKQRVAAASLAAMETAARVRARSRKSTSTTAEHRMPAPDGAGAEDAATDYAAADGAPDEATDEEGVADDEPGKVEPPTRQGPDWGELVRRLQWKRIAAIAAGIFVLAMGVILTFEAISGHAVSSYTGGSDPDGPRTSFGGGSGKGDNESDKPPPTGTSTTPAETTPAETTPTEGATTTEPGEEPTTASTTTAPTSPTEPPDETTTEPVG